MKMPVPERTNRAATVRERTRQTSHQFTVRLLTGAALNACRHRFSEQPIRVLVLKSGKGRPIEIKRGKCSQRSCAQSNGGKHPFIGEELMRMGWSRWIAVPAVAVSLTIPIPAASGAGAWQTGRVAAIEIDGQGADTKADTRPIRNSLWWTYGICAGTQTYYAASRVSPARLGLDIGSSVRFSATASQITLQDAHGKQHVLRISRKTESKDCSGRSFRMME